MLVKKIVLFATSFCFAYSSTAWTQESYFSDLSKRGRAMEYVIQDYPNQKLMTVRLLSGVRLPGTYRIPQGTKLSSLLSFSGGLDVNSDLTDMHILKPDHNSSMKVDFDALIASPGKGDPVLEKGDVVYIPPKEPIISNEAMAMTTFIASVVSIALSVVVITNQIQD